MKVRQSVSVTAELGDSNMLATFNGEVPLSVVLICVHDDRFHCALSV